MAFKIATDRAVAGAFIGDVQRAADTDKESLGFIPASAYPEALRKGEITLVLNDQAQGSVYAGHIWISGVYPHARVVQLFILPEFRGQKLSTRLLRSAIQTAEAGGYLTIKASVATDLSANQVYEHHGFEIIRTRPGGRTRKRQIHVRIKNLATPTLFNYRPTTSLTVADVGAGPEIQPLYLMDLNVFFDATRKRRTTKAAEKILSAALNSGVRLAVTSEFVKELQRTAIGKNDPVLSFAKQLPSVSGPSREEIESLASRLSAVVFPERTREETLSTNDKSDLKHLAEAILVGAAGFVTGERAIVRAHAALREQHHLSVWSTEDFAAFVTPAFEELSPDGEGEHDLSFKESALTEEAHNFLTAHGVSENMIAAFTRLDAADRRFRYVAARESTALVAFAAYRSAPGPTDSARLLLVADSRHPATSTAADFLIEHAVRASVLSRPSRIELPHVTGQSATRRVAVTNGFLGSGLAEDKTLRKISIGAAITPSGWSSLRSRVERSTGLLLPETCPPFENDEQQIAISVEGKTASVSLADLETMMAPGLLLLPGRPVAVVPIRRVWAEDLVGGSQLGLLPKPEAAFRSRRVYFASVVNQCNLVRGRPIIIYESGKRGGSGAAIAVARVSKAEVLPKHQAPEALLRAAVMRGVQLDNLVKGATVLAVWFDNIMRFENPVSFDRMEGFGMDDKTKLVKSHMLEFETAVQILEAGRPNAR